MVLFLFLMALELIASAATHLDAGFTESIIRITSNPFIALFIGLQVTAVIQSSSTLTASLVAMVAANIITLEGAVPMVLGANIGTTVTSILVSFGNLGTPKAFRRGFMVASSHVVFNVLTALLFIFFEMEAQVLSVSARYLAHWLSAAGLSGDGWFRFYQWVWSPFSALTALLVNTQPVVFLGLGLVLLFICIYLFSAIFKWIILGENGTRLLVSALSKPAVSLFSGMGLTAAIHSSTVTTSLAVVLATSKKIAPKKIFPFILGANVGTTITALMAAVGRTEAALAIALCHFIFNVVGVCIFYPFPAMRAVPVRIAKWTATRAARQPAFAFGYLLFVFFALPFLVIFLSEKR